MEIKEFSRIKKFFRPLTSAKLGAMELRDDAAILPVQTLSNLVISNDALVEGVHFRGDESAELIARKALRTNLSDLAAMGSKPLAYTLALVIGSNQLEDIDVWLEGFANGLNLDQKEFNIELIGGDSVTGQGPTTISIVIFGQLGSFGALLRSNAQIGDDVFVSGTIGDAAIGLKSLEKNITFHNDKNIDFSVQRYLLPRPRIGLGMALGGVASSAMDISDGLVQDLNHICSESGVGASILWQHIPLSPSTRKLLDQGQCLNGLILNGGDDYEIIFTAPPTKRKKVFEASEFSKTPVTRIGSIEKGDSVNILDAEGRILLLREKGYSHA